jgi:hypothetical protein
MIEHKKYEKSLKLNSGHGLTVKNLREMLTSLNDTDQLDVILCTKKLNHGQEDFGICKKLKALCARMNSLLIAAEQCVMHDVERENKSDINAIYYEKNGYNQGAKALHEDILNELENYPKVMIQLDLER